MPNGFVNEDMFNSIHIMVFQQSSSAMDQYIVWTRPTIIGLVFLNGCPRITFNLHLYNNYAGMTPAIGKFPSYTFLNPRWWSLNIPLACTSTLCGPGVIRV